MNDRCIGCRNVRTCLVHSPGEGTFLMTKCRLGQNKDRCRRFRRSA